MIKPLSKNDINILEEGGYWKASSYLHRIVKRLIRKKLPLDIEYIKEAHRIIFSDNPNLASMAGKYRTHNGPELKRIDGTVLRITDWRNIPNALAELNSELHKRTKNLDSIKTPEEYTNIISLSARLSHRLAFIHPFENGNGRASRLLLGAILLRAGLSDISIKKIKPIYLRDMRQADDGDFSLLENIIADGLLENKGKQYKILVRKQVELAKTKKHRNKN